VGGAAGIFGPATERAVIRVQTQRGIRPDGVVGAGTIRELGG
jgi:peptidoglycan hydrolase-like protein with peptidoglycan-binding domain